MLEIYWAKRVIASEHDGSGAARKNVCQAICEQMVSRRSFQGNVGDLESSVVNYIDDLKHHGVLVEWRPTYSNRPERNVVAFSHNVLFDYAAARMLLRGASNPGKSRIKADPGIVLTIRPSFDFHFHYLWLRDPTRQLFWDTVIDFQGEDVPPTGQLIGPSVAVECARNVKDLMPLAAALDSTERMVRTKAVNAVRHFTNALHASGPIVGRPTSNLWIAWLEELSKRIDPEVAFSVRAMLLNCLETDGQTIKENENLSSVAIRVFDYAQAHDQYRRWLIPVAVRAMCRNFGADPMASEARLRRLVSPESLSAGKIDGLVELTSEISKLFSVAPKLCEDIYANIFQADEPPEDKVRLFGSQLFDLVSNLRQDFDVNKYALGKVFDSFLDTSPEHAIPALTSVLEGYMARKSAGNQQPVFRFAFRGHEAHYSADGSSIWDESQVHRHDPEEMMIDSLQNRLESMAKLAAPQSRIELFLDLLAKHNRRAVIWRRLLQTGTKYPEQLGMSLLPLVKAEVALTTSDTRTQAGEFLRVIYPMLATNEREEIENVIMGLPLNSSSREEFAEDSRDRLLGCLSDNLLVTAGARQRLAELKATNSVPANEPDFQISSAGWMDQKDWETEYLGSLGVPHQEPQNANMRELMGPLRDFAQKFLNDIPTLSDVDSIWPNAVKLAEALSWAESEKVHAHLINDAIGYLAKFAQAVARNNEVLQDTDRAAFIMERLLTASTNSEPRPSDEMNEQFDRTPSWGSPSARIHAAEGLPLLCRNPRTATGEVLARVESLSRDPANVVRFMIAHRLVMLYQTNNDLFWQVTKRFANEERSPAVLAAFIASVLMRLPARDSEQAILMAETIIERVPSTENSQDARRTAMQLLVQRFVGSNHPRAREVLNSILDNSRSYLPELVSLPGTLREVLRFALLAHPTAEQEAICERAWELFDRVTNKAASLWRELRDQLLAAGRQFTREEQQTFQSLNRLLDVLVHEIYFASGAFDEKGSHGTSHPEQPLLQSRRRFLEKARPSLRELQSLGMANVTHRLVEFLSSYVEADPKEIFLEIGRSVLAAKESGYQQESLAADLIVRLVERYLAEFRHVLQSSKECQEMLLKVLDQFVAWPAALKLVYRLEEINR